MTILKRPKYSVSASLAGRLSILLGTLCAAISLSSLRPPEALPNTAPAELFSASRAGIHTHAIASHPRVPGTPGHQAARDYIEAQLSRHGLVPQRQTAKGPSLRAGGEAVELVNIMARLPGREPDKSLLLVAHYDTVPLSPGAADNGAGVAALLETLRALAAGPTPRNDIVFLFTDGEESGLVGANTFLLGHPWAQQIGAVLNFEARGVRGPSLMFETSAGNGPLIRELRRAGVPAKAMSYSYEIYRVMPNSTDFAAFRRAGMSGLNFAFIHGSGAYHSPHDRPEALDPDSLQHHGELALGLARHFGEADLSSLLQGDDAVYFNIGPALVAFSYLWMPALALLLAALTGLLLTDGVRRRRLRIGRLLIGFAAMPIAGLVVGLTALVATKVVRAGRDELALAGGFGVDSLTVLGGTLASVALALWILSAMLSKLNSEHLTTAGVTLWTLIAVPLAWLAPGASYLYVLPALPATVAAGLRSRRSSEDAASALETALSALAAGLSSLLWAPALALLPIALSEPGIVIAGACTLMVLGGPWAPAVGLLSRRDRNVVLPAIALAAALVVTALVHWGGLTPSFTEDASRSSRPGSARSAK